MRKLAPSQLGAVAESAIATAALELGLNVLRPVCEGSRYDLVIDLEPRLLRVQCKLGHLNAGVLAVRLKTCRYTPRGYVHSSYTPAEVDAVAAYSPELRRSFIIPIAEASGRRAIHLRLDPTLNNQAQGIRRARDHEFGPALERLSTKPADSPRGGAATLLEPIPGL